MKPTIVIPDKLKPVFLGKADVRGSHGGRGSAKTRTFAKMTAVRAHMWDQAGLTGIVLCGRQFMNSLDESSLSEVKAAIQSEPWLAEHFDIGDKYVRTKSKRIVYKFAGLDRSIESIKSKSRILLCWVDEAEPVTDEAWQVLIPTLREEESELWVTWNPKRKSAAVEARFRHATDPLYKIVQMNWRDNPWFPERLERERQRTLRDFPDQYAHIWEGDYATVLTGAYYADSLREAREKGRIGKVAPDPLMTYRAYWDIGGTGQKADATSIWIVQFIGKEIRVLDYYEAKGQPLAAHVNWLREKGYSRALCVLPHDGEQHEKIRKATYEGALQDAGFSTDVVPNQGAGAAKMRIEATRRLFPAIWFNEDTTQAGIDALGWYHAKQDEKRDVDLGPEHDWASHAADAFGMMCMAYEEPRNEIRKPQRHYQGAGNWMG